MNPNRLKQLLLDDSVVITGMGVHCAAGTDVGALWRTIVAGESCAREIDLQGEMRALACLAGELDVDHDTRLRAARRTDRSVQLALSAALEAADQAGVDGGRLSVIAGTSRGPQQQWDAARALMDAGRRLRPTMAATGTVACMSGLLAQQLGATGPGFTVSATCSSGANAIALAAQQLILGEADAVLAGGSDAPVHPLVLRGLESAGMLGSTCRPFDSRRDGLVVGEGAGFLMLELESHAVARGGQVLARLEGWATGIDGHGRTGIREDGAGLVDVLVRALALADLEADEIGYINAHGTATELNDRIEAATFARLFGGGVPVSSTKAVTGHCLGGTPAIEAIVAVRAMEEGLLPATVGLSEVAKECSGIDHVIGGAREVEVGHVLSDSVGFWGYHACLVFGRV